MKSMPRIKSTGQTVIRRKLKLLRLFSWDPQTSPAEIAFGSGARATSIPGFIQHKLVFNSHHTSSDFADFLPNPSPLHQCIQGKVDSSCIHKS
jgi:hypothetical protein